MAAQQDLDVLDNWDDIEATDVNNSYFLLT